VREDSLLAALPGADRLGLRPEELRKKPSEQAWVQEVTVRERLEARRAQWRQELELSSVRVGR
jgi:hypothetical protein